MGALAGIAVSALGTAAGTAVGQAVRGDRPQGQLSRLQRFAQSSLIQPANFDDLTAGSVTGIPTSLSEQRNTLLQQSIDAQSNEMLKELRTLNPGSPEYQALNTKWVDLRKGRPVLQTDIMSFNRKLEARRKEREVTSFLKAERQEIAGRQSLFRKQIREGQRGPIQNLSTKTILGS